MMEIVERDLHSHLETAAKVIEDMKFHIYTACIITVETLKNGKKILIFGNGGSAADAQHIAAELTGRFKKERKGLPAIALTTDTSALTAIANDYGYEQVFARQVEALAQNGDLCIGISTSGNSENVLRGLEVAKTMGCKTIGLSGKEGGKMASLCDANIVVPSNETARIQEMHILIGHIICAAVDEAF
ncbi:D-sedoheptulose 7-phosphate isomerase [Nitrosophilus alvini]|uniref:D-sedoheptulose 7-phosphate isomerase n=1 Tax=Nitrosophilus alvini TaxID=2714855 RepID=UPI00190B4AA4|nr:D-sedoheptulose 7-phosphate isomerase [Nitrosophilus alvini]